MARRHGWQLPAHTFQVVAITVFFLLSVAFYAFFAPFLGRDLYEDVAIGVYTCLAFSVFILYVRCTGIDPADPGILVAFDETSAFHSCNKPDMSMSAASLGQPGLKTVAEFTKDDRSSSCSNIGCFFCSIIVKDDCRGEGEDMDNLPQQTEDEDALFCTLCNAEVQKHSKHCRSCDKCVDGFDHHCRWLNNCVGKKNYVSFFSLMAVSLVWLMVECAVGISVLTRCFTDKKGTKNQIYDRLGNGFSLVPFATVVGLCTIVSLVALIPLAELFFFHMILIKKGITTYEYVVAMRVQSEPPGPSLNGDQQSLPSSPGSLAATTLSGRSSLGIHHKGAWCTPPRIFIDHQDEVVPHLGQGRVPSIVDPDVMQCHKGKRVSKPPVRISAWRLAKLNSEEAIRAGAKARASSSVLHPISSRNPYDTDRCSSGRSSAISLDIAGYGKDQRIGMARSSRKSSYPPSRASRDDIEAYAQSQSSFGSPYPHGSSSIALSPPLERDSNRDRLNQVYESSASQSPRSVQTGDGNGSGVVSYFDPMMDYRRYNGGGSDHLIPSSFLEGNTRNISIRAIQSTFLGSFIPNEEMARSDAYGSKTSSSNNHQGRAERGSQLPVFVSRDSQMSHFSIFP